MLTPCFVCAFGEDTPADLVLYSPESQGLIPLGPAIMVDDVDFVPSGKQEGIGVCITEDGKVAYSAHRVGGLRMYDIHMNNIPWAKDADGSNWVLYFDDEGNPFPKGSASGVKIKANLFGPGWGIGSYTASVQTPSLAVAQSLGQTPILQLFQNDGTPIVPAKCGVPEDFAAAAGDIRIGDFDFLSNGNIVTIGESRQLDENINLFGVPEALAGNVIVLSIMKPDEQFPTVHFGRLTEEPTRSETWHGLGVTQNGFAARVFKGASTGAVLRFFQNDGTPLTGDVPLTQFGEGEIAGVLGTGTGRGDQQGWHGDGGSRYILASLDYLDLGYIIGSAPFVGIFSEFGDLIVGPVHVTGGPDGWSWVDGSLDDGRIDAALQSDPATGRFICVWADKAFLGLEAGILMGRIFEADGTPLTKMIALDNHFDIGLMEQAGLSRRPRVVWRGNKIAVAWVTTNFDENPNQMCTLRTFTFGEEAVSDFMLY